MTPASLCYDVAMSQIGTLEIPGAEHSPRVLQYFREIGHKWVDDDETPWCAAFANWVCKYAQVVGTGRLNARSFLKVGTETNEPEKGDIVVFWRDDIKSAKGHVGFYIGKTDTHIYVLGGNQSNKVCIAAYPVARLLGYRQMEWNINV